MLDLAHQRQQMIDLQLAVRGISNLLVLEAMRRVPRERFVAQGLEEFAYEDSPLPIEAGQTISQPYIVAVMIEAAQFFKEGRKPRARGGAVHHLLQLRSHP